LLIDHPENSQVFKEDNCPHFDRSPAVQWTKNYINICSTMRSNLEEWAIRTVGGDGAHVQR
jgi:hypothetical protein